jgi:hypothetical protein
MWRRPGSRASEAAGRRGAVQRRRAVRTSGRRLDDGVEVFPEIAQLYDEGCNHKSWPVVARQAEPTPKPTLTARWAHETGYLTLGEIYKAGVGSSHPRLVNFVGSLTRLRLTGRVYQR